MQVPNLEKQMGIEVYATHAVGIGGVIREDVEDFAVEEMLVDGSKANINPSDCRDPARPLGCSPSKNRYLLCVMVKRNWDTLAAVDSIADKLDVGIERIQIAGMKDARAVTAQHLTLDEATPEMIQAIRIRDVEIRPLGYLRNGLSAYYLLGNSFHIRIKAISHPEPAIRKSVSAVVQEINALGGVPNFFGHQRFGTTRPITHLVGKAIVKKEFQKAAMLFLSKSSPHENAASRSARQELEATQNFAQALKGFPKQLWYERLMLKHLARRPFDFGTVFRTLPLRLQLMFIHAYESYLFNKFLSRRISRGLPLDTVEVGDYAVALERSGLASSRVYTKVSLEKRAEVNNSVKAGKARLAIPLIGFSQHPSSGVQGEIEQRILEEEEVSPEDFRIQGMREVSARGSLRTATTPVKCFSTDEVSPCLGIRKKRQTAVSFALNRGSYATIVLRELMKPRDVIKQGF